MRSTKTVNRCFIKTANAFRTRLFLRSKEHKMNELKKREREKKKMQLLLSGCYFEPEGKASFVYGSRINKMENDLLASLMYQNR